MVDGRLVFPPGSTVPTLEAADSVIPAAMSNKIEPVPEADGGVDTSGDVDMTEVKAEPIDSPPAPIKEPTPQKVVQEKPSVPSSIFVGDLRLAILKARLAGLTNPIPAEFAGEGVLICGSGVREGEEAKAGSIVAVRKLREGSIVLEGGVGKTYDLVRKELYKGFARVVAA